VTPVLQARARRTQALRSLLGLLCIALVLLAGGVHLLHDHATVNGTDPACSLCTLCHVAVAEIATTPAPAALEAVVFAPPVSVIAAPSRYFALSLYVRPPPSEARASLS
jgi:hypothetical protein